jgi:hypothetical protein
MAAKLPYHMGKVRARLDFLRQRQAGPVLVGSKPATPLLVLDRQPVVGGSREMKLLSIPEGRWTSKMDPMTEPKTLKAAGP